MLSLMAFLEVPIYIQNERITRFLIYGPFLPYQWLLMLYLQPLFSGFTSWWKETEKRDNLLLREAVYQGKQMALCFLCVFF